MFCEYRPRRLMFRCIICRALTSYFHICITSHDIQLIFYHLQQQFLGRELLPSEHVSGAERAKYSRITIKPAERVFIQRPERSLCLAPVPLRYRSHHESRACTNPPRIHLCLQQLTKLSAYTSKIVRCEGEMEFVK